MAETAAQRYARDWASQEADRKTRGLENQSEGRRERLYVDDSTGDSAADTGTVGPDN
jgi:hypothetical protein